MARNNDSKAAGFTLQKRLDILENELKVLHEKILQRKLRKIPVAEASQALSNESISLIKANGTSGWWGSTKEDGRDWFNCLKSITRSIAQGSDAIRRIASLTDVTSISGTLSSLLPTNTAHPAVNKIKPTQSSIIGMNPKNLEKKLNKDLLCFNVKSAMPAESSSAFSQLENDNLLTKSVSLSRSEGEISLFQSQSRLQLNQSRSVRDCKKTLLRENHRLKQQISVSKELKKELHDLRKKLKEEMKRRYQAEKKTLEILKDVTEMKAERLICNEKECINNKINSDGLESDGKFKDDVQSKRFSSEELPAESQKSFIEKEFDNERERRIKLEEVVGQLQGSLKEKKKEVVELTTGQKLALAFAEQFRAQCEKSSDEELAKGDYYLMKALKESNAKCCILQEEMAIIKSKLDLSCSNEHFKERALKAEAELQSIQDQLNINSLDTSQLQSALSKHEKSYYELLLSKKCSEAEYKARYRQLEGEIGKLHAYYEKRIEMLNEKVKDLMLQLQEKIISIENITHTKDNCDVATLKGMISMMGSRLKEKDALIESFNESLATNVEKRKAIEEERNIALRELKHMQLEASKCLAILEDKDHQLNELLAQLSLKSDEIAIKEKILIDHTETITSLKKRIQEINDDSEMIEKAKKDMAEEINALTEDNDRLRQALDSISTSISEATKYKEGQEKNYALLKHLENQVYERQKQWDQQLFALNKEKDQAIQTAKFATQKLVSAVGEYESELKNRKQLEQMLKTCLTEKDEKLQHLQRDLERVTEEAATAQNKVEVLKLNFQKRFNHVCTMCADVIDQVPSGTSEYT